MDSDLKEVLYLERARSELNLAKAIFKLSTNKKLKLEFELMEDATFFSNVISNSYYCIFYSAKALLEKKGIIVKAPEEHKKTLDEFEKLVVAGEIDANLLIIYRSIVVKADELLGIFSKEKKKRGKFTYKKLPQANLEPAEESLENAEKFFKNINMIVGGKKMIKLIIFDLSGVCFNDEEKPFLKRLAERNNLEYEKVDEIYFKHVGLEADEGKITGIEAWQRTLDELGIEENPAEIIEEMYDGKVEFKETLDLIKKLKTKYKVAFLTNLCKEHFDAHIKRFDVTKIFDFGIASYMIKTRKPDPKTYQTIMEHFNVKPEETIFIDDSEKNANGAKAIGINTIHLTDRTKIKELLQEKGVDID